MAVLYFYRMQAILKGKRPDFSRHHCPPTLKPVPFGKHTLCTRLQDNVLPRDASLYFLVPFLTLRDGTLQVFGQGAPLAVRVALQKKPQQNTGLLAPVQPMDIEGGRLKQG